MKKRIVIKFSGRIFGVENIKLLKDYARFLVKISKSYQPIIIAGGGKIARHYISHARSSGADDKAKIVPAIKFSLEEALEYIQKDEYVEVTPNNLRLRKILLKEVERKRNKTI